MEESHLIAKIKLDQLLDSRYQQLLLEVLLRLTQVGQDTTSSLVRLSSHPNPLPKLLVSTITLLKLALKTLRDQRESLFHLSPTPIVMSNMLEGA
jgi:hypothetical protein